MIALKPQTREEKRAAKRAVSVMLSVVLLGVIVLSFTGAGAAQGYYNDTSGVVQPDSPSQANVSNIVSQIVELPPSFIGTGVQDPSGTGFQGVLLTGLVFAGVSVGAMAGAGVGTVGGTVLGSLVAYGLVDLGYAPEWTKILLLIGIGIITFSAFRRVLE